MSSTDDCLTGTEDSTSAIQLQQDLFKLLKKGGMMLRKWRSNDPAVLSSIPEELREKDSSDLVISDASNCNKTLGVHWNTARDELYVSTPQIEDSIPTKRVVPSAAARLYDLLGSFGPVTLFIKILLQKIWQSGTGWNEPIPRSLLTKWEEWKSSLHLLGSHPIPRCYHQSTSTVRETQLHGFSDASQDGGSMLGTPKT